MQSQGVTRRTLMLTTRPSLFRAFSTHTSETPIILKTCKNNITTLQMNRPLRLNAWTGAMMDALRDEFATAALEPEIRGLILTGSGRYYCAGVDLGSTLRPMTPRTLHAAIAASNRRLFDSFLDFPKPLFVAANGPAVGASATSATLADRLVALEGATFHTPFHALGICPEGCSSEYFGEIMGEEAARRMLGPEGWKATAAEWRDLGVVSEVVGSTNAEVSLADQAALMEKTQELMEEWIQNGRVKAISDTKRQKLKELNARESLDLATCFLSLPFLEGQYRFAKSKNNTKVANLFWGLKTFRPLWSLML